MWVNGAWTIAAATPDPWANRSGLLANVIVPPAGAPERTTTSAVLAEPICTMELLEYPDPDARTTEVDPTVPPEFTVVALVVPDPTVERSPNALSIQKPPTSRNMGPPKLKVASSTPRMSL